MPNNITANIRLDTDQFTREMSRFRSGLAGLGRAVVRGGALVAAGAVAGATASRPLVAAASDLNESMSRSDVVFGDQADAMKAFASTASRTAGLSKRAALDFANGFGGMGTGAGFAGEQLADFSTDLVGLTADLSSAVNIGNEDAFTKILSGLAGETEPLRRFGFDLAAVTVEAKAAELGFEKVNGQFTNQAKVLARNALLFEQAAALGITGDFERTADQFANASRSLGAEFENLKADIGQVLLPVAILLVDWMRSSLIPSLRSFGRFIRDDAVPAVREFGSVALSWFGRVVDVVRSQWPTIRSVGETVFGWIRDNVIPIAVRVAGGAADAFRRVADEVRDRWPEIRAVAADVFGWIRTNAIPIAQRIGRTAVEWFQRIVDVVRDNWPAIRRVAQQTFGWIQANVIPIVLGVGKAIRDGVIAVFQWFAANSNRWKAALVGLAAVAGTLLVAAFIALGVAIAGALSPLVLIALAIGALVAAVTFAYLELDAFRAAVDAVAAVAGPILAAFFELAKGLFEAFLLGLQGIIEFVKGVFTGDWDLAWEGLKKIFESVWKALVTILEFQWEAMKTVWSNVLGWIAGLGQSILEAIGDLGLLLWQKGLDLIGGFLNAIVSFAGIGLRFFFVTLPLQILEWIGDLGLTLLTKGWDLIRGFISGITGYAEDLWQWFRDLPGAIKDFFADAGTWLYNAGQSLIQGFLSGAADKAKSAGGFLSNIRIPGVTNVGDVVGLGGDLVDAVSGSSGGAGGSQVQGISTGSFGLPNLVLELNGQEFGRVTTDAVVAESERRGGIDLTVAPGPR